MKTERITDTISYHGEGPVWWPATGRLRFVDMLAGAVIELDERADGGHRRLDVPSPVASVIRPRRGGGAIVATERGLALGRAEDLSDLAPAVELYADETIRTNEGGCDPDGRMWVGTMSYDKVVGAAKVFRWDGPGSQPVEAWGGATTANGLGFSPDGARAYWVDTPTRTITVLDYDAGAGLVDPRPWVVIESGAGKPDGLTVDAEGGVWVAMHRGGAVRRYDSDGRLSEVVTVPVSKVTACAFGGPGLDQLFITTSRENLPDDAEPASGSVYVCRPGAAGLEPLPFAG